MLSAAAGLTLLAGFAGLTGCAPEGPDDATGEGDRVEVRFTTKIDGAVTPSTRVTGNEWEAGDKIYVYMVEHGTTDIVDGAEGCQYVYDEENGFVMASPEDVIYYPQLGEVDFIAMHSWWGDTIPFDELFRGYMVEYAPLIDHGIFWVGADNGGAGYNRKSGPVELDFRRVHSQIVFNLIPGAGITAEDIGDRSFPTIYGLKNGISFHPATGTLSAIDIPDLPEIDYEFRTEDGILRIPLAPYDYEDGELRVEFPRIGPANETFVWTLTAAQASFAANTQYTYDVVISRTGVTATGRITPWDEVPRAPITTSPPFPEYVEMDGLRWASRNVGATPGKFASDPWDGGGYYNFDEAQTACPEGWRVPTPAEFERLIAAGSRWTTEEGASGRRFGSGENSVFLPAAGGDFDGADGYYWSDVHIEIPDYGTYGHIIHFNADHAYFDTSSIVTNELPVRCVQRFYRVGDVYPADGEPLGVVYELNPNAAGYNPATGSGQHGKIVSLDEGSGNWWDVMAWVDAKKTETENWYLPSQGDLPTLYNAWRELGFDIFNQCLTDANGIALRDEQGYWSSSEYGPDHAYFAYFRYSYYSSVTTFKSRYYAARAVADF
jgi:hypothetical protein